MAKVCPRQRKSGQFKNPGHFMNMRILQYLDEPERYFIFTPDELVAVVAPLAVLTLVANFVFGIAAGAGAFWLLRRLKKGGTLSKLMWAAYWLLPSRTFGLKRTPPSDQRLLVG